MAIKGRSFLKAALLVAASAGLSGCVYDIGLGSASDGYYEDGYACDPYGGYDAYYHCDYGQAFSNIGFGGGWYDNYFYPGHGIFLFDTFGRRFPMREQYRRYWGERRHNWYREHRGRDRGGSRYGRIRPRYNDDTTTGAHGWRDGHDDQRNSRRRREHQSRGKHDNGVNAVPMSTPRAIDLGSRRPRQEDGFGRPDRRGDRSAEAAAFPAARVQQDSGAVPSTPPRAAPPPRSERPPASPRQGRDEGDNIRDD